MSNSSNSSNDNSSDSSMYLLATLGEYRYYLNEFEEAKKRLDAFVSENRELRRYFTHISGTRVTDNNASTECLPQRPQNFIHTLYSILNDNANSDCICWFTTANGKSAFTVKSWNKLIKLFNLAGFKVGQELSIRKNLADYRFEKLNDRRKRVLVEEYDDDFVSNDSDSDNTKELLASTTGDSFCHKHFKPKRARLWLVVRRGPQKRTNDTRTSKPSKPSKPSKAGKMVDECSLAATSKPRSKRARNSNYKDNIKSEDKAVFTNKRRRTLP